MGLLLTQGAKVDIQAPGGLTPLHFAARYFDKLLMHPFMYIHVHMDLKISFCSLRFKISQEGVKDVEVIKSSYKPKISNDEEMDQVYEHTLEIDPAIHMLVQHGADVNMKDRSVNFIVTRYLAKTHF